MRAARAQTASFAPETAVASRIEVTGIRRGGEDDTVARQVEALGRAGDVAAHANIPLELVEPGLYDRGDAQLRRTPCR